MNTVTFEVVKVFAVLIVVLIAFLPQNEACFIRNCPPGGKRSMDILPQATRQCMACGPSGFGQCVATNICCGQFGCLIGTQESEICEKENESTTPCSIRGTSCGIRNQGHCVADGICCSSFGTCSQNSKCKINLNRGNSEIITLIDRLLENRDYSD